MRIERRGIVFFRASALAAAALAPSCATAPPDLVRPIDITIVKDTSKIGYSFLAYLSLLVDLSLRDAAATTDSGFDVYLCWKEDHFYLPTQNYAPCPFHSEYVSKRWEGVPLVITGHIGRWHEGVDFWRKPNSPAPRAVHAHVTYEGDTYTDQDTEDDRIHDP